MRLLSSHDEQQLMQALRAAQDSARQTGRKRIAGFQRSIADLDFLAVFAAADQEERFFGQRPNRHQAFVALGCAAQVIAEGRERFALCSREATQLFEGAALTGYGELAEERPLLLGGFAFNDAAPALDSPWAGFPAARLVLPQLLITRNASARDDDQIGVSLSLHAEIGADGNLQEEHDALLCRVRWLEETLEHPIATPKQASIDSSEETSEGPYVASVRKALGSISRGELEKVVVARSCTVQSKESFDPSLVLGNLRRNYPSCFIFAASRSGISFLGATPERLLALRGNEIHSGPLAGSIPRGQDQEEDKALARQLFESKKEQAEHAVVVRAIQNALQPFCADLQVPEAPEILQLTDIQHLYTPIQGNLAEPKSILDILDRLHPTPAVAGSPHSAAMKWLAENEGLERGWYAGPIGWMNDRGEGDFAIALRAALLRNHEAYLNAGAGIVDGSVPESEFAETRLKMRAALSAILEVE